MMNCFCGLAERERRKALYPTRTIVRDSHHGKYLTRLEQNLNLPIT